MAHQPAPIYSPELAKDLLHALDDLNGVHPGFRPAHAKGVMLTGTFTPSAEASSLTRAPHATRPSTAVTVRFSNSGGFPEVADNDPQFGSPRGMAIRFHLGEHEHTDIISHSVDAFPVRTPELFLEFLRAVKASGPGAAHPSPVELFVSQHPSALMFVQMPKPTPSSFARERYFAVNAFQFTNSEGVSHFGRYRIVPEAGEEHLDAETAKTKTANFLFDEISDRVSLGEVKFKLTVQIAESGDVVDDATAHWPEQRSVVEFGTLVLNTVSQPDDSEKKRIIFDPIPRVDGIEGSGDPLLAARADVYLMSGRRRRSAG